MPGGEEDPDCEGAAGRSGEAVGGGWGLTGGEGGGVEGREGGGEEGVEVLGYGVVGCGAGEAEEVYEGAGLAFGGEGARKCREVTCTS